MQSDLPTVKQANLGAFSASGAAHRELPARRGAAGP